MTLSSFAKVVIKKKSLSACMPKCGFVACVWKQINRQGFAVCVPRSWVWAIWPCDKRKLCLSSIKTKKTIQYLANNLLITHPQEHIILKSAHLCGQAQKYQHFVLWDIFTFAKRL